MLSEFGVSNLDITLRVESQSPLAIAIGQGSWRTRHRRLRATCLREKSETGEIIPVYCPRVKQAADFFTKALPSARILELAVMWGLLEGTARPAEAQACSETRTAHNLAAARPAAEYCYCRCPVSLVSGWRCCPPVHRRGRGLASPRVARCRFDAGSIHHLHWFVSASSQCGSSSNGAFKVSSPADRQGHPRCP